MKTTYVSDIDSDSTEYTLLGWMTRKRVHGGVIFLDIADSTGKIQAIVARDTAGEETFERVKRLKEESAVSVQGISQQNSHGLELCVHGLDVKAEATMTVEPSPRHMGDPFNGKHIEHIVEHPSFFLRNEKMAAALKTKSVFRRNLEQYFWDEGYIQFEPPTLTVQTLYADEGAFWVDVHGQQVSLSRCATFHLEPALMAYEKVFALTNSFAHEMSRSDRHLAEYTHLKAELAWVNLDELIAIAGNMYYAVAKKTAADCAREAGILGVDMAGRAEHINPANTRMITYDAAITMLNENGVEIEYGKSLSSADEKLLTQLHGDRFLWIKHVPCSAEGFPFKRKADAPHLTMTCDLVAPYGFGEILGTAEKITDKQELLERMAEKGKATPEQLARYQDYVNLREYGLPDHGGIGMGIERAARYLMMLPHVRFTRPFPVLHGTKVTF